MNREKMFRIGQEVFFPGDHFIGLVTKLFFSSEGQVTHLAIRTARLLGYHKTVTVAYIREANSKGGSLDTNIDRFRKLSEYK